MSRRNNDSELIRVDVEPQQIRPLAYELNRERIPFQVYQDARTQQYSVETHQAAEPILQQVLGAVRRADLFDRQPQHRNDVSDALGFLLSFMVLGVIIYQSARVAVWADAAGVNGDITRGIVILVVGIISTLFWSEVLMGNDKRRYLFKQGMFGLYLVAGAWFVLHGMGVL